MSPFLSITTTTAQQPPTHMPSTRSSTSKTHSGRKRANSPSPSADTTAPAGRKRAISTVDDEATKAKKKKTEHKTTEQKKGKGKKGTELKHKKGKKE